MVDLGSNWRTIAGVETAWFDAPTLVAAAALARRVPDDALVEVRADGVRVRVTSPSSAYAVSTAAQELGLVADPSGLQQVGVVLESTSPGPVASFWQPLLDDPLRREVVVSFRGSDDDRPLRNRWHLDVVRPGGVVARLGLGDGAGPFGVRHGDPDGNEVDLVPGDPLEEAPDWQGVFSAIACYRVTSAAQQHELVAAAAGRAGSAGFPLLVDVRPGAVVLDTGKDQSDPGAHGLDLDFGVLAADLQRTARDLGAVADTSLPCFVQVFLDAADVAAVRAFWVAALGYVPDPREDVTDIVDPCRLGPPLVLQALDAEDLGDAARRSQRNRTHLELHLPADVAAARVDVAVGAGGRVLAAEDGCWRIADPEGNEVVLVGEGGVLTP